MIEGIGKAFDGLYKFAMFSLFVLLPLSVWKVIDILVWIYQHVRISWQ